jgi:alpha-tubulin suppressor-like RCC1 family protein
MPNSRLNGALDYKQLKQKWMGEWQDGVIYNLNDTVRVNGKAYVCNSTYFYDNNLKGKETSPAFSSQYWTVVTPGSLYKGDWSFKDYHYAGDIVRFNSDFYQCVTDNFGGHPIYENGGLSTKWVLIAKSPRSAKQKNKIWFKNYPPMGWTRNMCETPSMTEAPGYCSSDAINGNYESGFVGRKYSGNRHGLGEHSGDWKIYSAPYPGGTWFNSKKQGFDFWDYQDGYRPTLTGKEPRIIQYTGSEQHDMVLFDNGEVYHTGYGGHGQNGDSTASTTAYFKRVGRANTGGRGTGTLRDKFIIKVGASDKSGGSSTANMDTHSCFAISNAGEVFTWGYNGYGQLGAGDTSDRSAVYQIPQGYFHNKKVVDMWMSGGNYQNSYAMTEDGELYSWGYGGDGALGTGSFQNFYRPERIKYNWTMYGGIKKIQMKGYAAESVLVVLTNDGTLHGCGNIYDDSYPIYGAGSNNNTYTPIMTPLAQLMNERSQSLGVHREVGALVDVTRNVEDFWLFGAGGMAHTIIVKEKNTGLMYGWGYNGYNQLPVFRRSIGIDEYSADNPYTGPNLAFPALLMTLNFTNIKYIQNAGQDSNGTYMWLNSDGRVMTNGGNGQPQVKGLGILGMNPDSSLRRTQKLPWETHFTDYAPVQLRFAEKVLMMSSTNEGSTAGFQFITTNNRFVNINQGWSWYYSWDPTAQGTNGFSNGTPIRVDF